MMNGMKRLFATFASSTLLAASMLIAVPASAQTSGGPGDNYGCYDPTGGYNQCCYYTYYYDYSGNYIYGCCYNYFYAGAPPECYPVYYQPSEDPAHRPSQEPTEPAGQ
jgi:hypothetical protein